MIVITFAEGCFGWSCMVPVVTQSIFYQANGTTCSSWAFSLWLFLLQPRYSSGFFWADVIRRNLSKKKKKELRQWKTPLPQDWWWWCLNHASIIAVIRMNCSLFYLLKLVDVTTCFHIFSMCLLMFQLKIFFPTRLTTFNCGWRSTEDGYRQTTSKDSSWAGTSCYNSPLHSTSS